MPTLNEAKRKYTEWLLTDAATQLQLAARINEVTAQIGSPTLTGFAAGTQISNAQTGNGNSTTVFDFGSDSHNNVREAVLVRLVTVVGATPTVTIAIQGSLDGTTFSALQFADSASPSTFASSTFVVTSATTLVKLIKPGQRYRYLRVVYSANTNVTTTVDVYPLGD